MITVHEQLQIDFEKCFGITPTREKVVNPYAELDSAEDTVPVRRTLAEVEREETQRVHATRVAPLVEQERARKALAPKGEAEQ